MAENENKEEQDPKEDKDQRIRDLEAQVQHLSKMLIKSFNYAEQDPDTFLQNARKTTEAICRFIYVQEIGEPKKKMLLNDLAKELRNRQTVPDRILILIGTIQTYGNYGAHVQEGYEESTKEWITPCQTALANLTNWFFVEYLHGKVPMPEELVEPVKEKANEAAPTGSGNGKKALPYILGAVAAATITLVVLFLYPGLLNETGTAEGEKNGTEASKQGNGGIDEEAKSEEEKATAQAIDSLNQSNTAAEDATRLAVLYFENTSDNKELDGLRKGLASMLISDLSELKGLQVVERDRLQELLEEQELSNSEKFDPSTAAEVGKLLGAERILIGSYFEMMGQLRIDARTIDVETGEILHSEGLEGKKDKFFALEQKLVRKIAGQLDLGGETPKTAEEGISYDAASTYSAGLDLLDEGEHEKARKKFEQVLELEPSFQPAKDALERTAQPS